MSVLKIPAELTVTFPLLGKLFILLNEGAGRFAPLNLNTSLADAIQYASETGYLEDKVTAVEPFATPLLLTDEEQIEFLAVVRSQDIELDGRVVYYSSYDSRDLPAVVAPDLYTLLPDLAQRTLNKPTGEIHYPIHDFCTGGLAFSVPLFLGSERIIEHDLHLSPTPISTNQGLCFTPKVVEVAKAESPYLVELHFLLDAGGKRAEQTYLVHDNYRGLEESPSRREGLNWLETNRYYSFFVHCIHQFRQGLGAAGYDDQGVLAATSLSTTYLHALYTQGQPRPDGRELPTEGVFTFRGKQFNINLGWDKTRLSDTREDMEYVILLKGIEKLEVHGLSEEAELRIVGFHNPEDGRYDLLAEVVSSPGQPASAGAILYLEKFHPWYTNPNLPRKAERVYEDINELLRECPVTDYPVYLKPVQENHHSKYSELIYPLEKVGYKNSISGIQISLEHTPDGYLFIIDYQLGFARYIQAVQLETDGNYAQERLRELLTDLITRFRQEQSELDKLLRRFHVPTLIGLALHFPYNRRSIRTVPTVPEYIPSPALPRAEPVPEWLKPEYEGRRRLSDDFPKPKDFGSEVLNRLFSKHPTSTLPPDEPERDWQGHPNKVSSRDGRLVIDGSYQEETQPGRYEPLVQYYFDGKNRKPALCSPPYHGVLWYIGLNYLQLTSNDGRHYLMPYRINADVLDSSGTVIYTYPGPVNEQGKALNYEHIRGNFFYGDHLFIIHSHCVGVIHLATWKVTYYYKPGELILTGEGGVREGVFYFKTMVYQNKEYVYGEVGGEALLRVGVVC